MLLSFQSTRPARGATVSDATVYHVRLFQSTRPARGATVGYLTREQRHEFQSTRPARGATITGKPFRELFGISIHAPREGRDAVDT